MNTISEPVLHYLGPVLILPEEYVHMASLLHKTQSKCYYLMGTLELGISGLIIVGIALRLTGLPSELSIMAAEGMSGYLKYLYDILIAIELIKLLCRHDLSSMVEVLMFAVSRQVIIEHLKVWENLIAVCSIAALFAIRKFLFIHRETYEEEKKRRMGL